MWILNTERSEGEGIPNPKDKQGEEGLLVITNGDEG